MQKPAKKTAEDMKSTLRYKHKVSALKGQPAYKKEAELLREIAVGKQWRIDAVIEAIEANPADWSYIHTTHVMKQAAMFGRLATIERLCAIFEYGEKERGGTPEPIVAAFHVASLHGHYKTADFLATRGAKPDYISRDGTVPAINWAVREGSKAKVDYLLKKGADKDHAAYLAASTGQLPLLKHLVEKRGAGVNYAAEGFWTPFLNAVKQHREDIMDYVLAKGATPWLDKGAGEALYNAVGDGRLPLVKRMLGLGFTADAQTLHHAIYNGKLDVAETLITQGGVAVNSGKQEALLLAIASKEQAAAVRLCLKHGADAAKALDALNRDPELYRYGQRDKMKQYLEDYLAAAAAKPAAKGPAL